MSFYVCESVLKYFYSKLLKYFKLGYINKGLDCFTVGVAAICESNVLFDNCYSGTF